MERRTTQSEKTQATMSDRAFTRDELAAIIEVYEVLHGARRTPALIRHWAATKIFTPQAWEYLVAYCRTNRELWFSRKELLTRGLKIGD